VVNATRWGAGTAHQLSIEARPSLLRRVQVPAVGAGELDRLGYGRFVGVRRSPLIAGCRSQPRIDRLALHREDTEHAFVDAVERLAAHESVERLDAEPELADGERALASEAA